MAVLSQTQKGAAAQFSKGPKRLAVGTVHEVHKVAGQFEWGRLEARILTRRTQKVETKVNVYQVPSIVQENVAIMSILDLQQETNDGVSS